MLKQQAHLVAMIDEADVTADQLRLIYAHTHSLRDLISASDQHILPENLESMYRVIKTMQQRLESMFVNEHLAV